MGNKKCNLMYCMLCSVCQMKNCLKMDDNNHMHVAVSH